MQGVGTGFKVGLVAVTMAVLAALAALPASAAHIGNNKAELSGDGATGTSVANYSTGTDTIRANVRVRGLEAGQYTFQIRHANGTVTSICTFTAKGTGAAGCSGATSGRGFHHADVVDDAGNLVATGEYERRGNCREADQAGSLCTAPGRT
ncbi:MAG TPA: hypothetical protein VM324_15680 [Egibacteraceae bacterium]|jgi:hypothetical protein|nr:hypothetical protein [Egibacteraceae bacterium]